MNWLESFLYGLVSGISEFLPVSSQAHQAIMLQLFGTSRNYVSDLLVHISAMVALYLFCRGLISKMRREQLHSRGRRRTHNADVRNTYDLRLIRSAVVPLMLFMLLLIISRQWIDSNLIVALFSLVGGFVIFIGERFPHGNKDSRHMTILDAFVFGIAGALSVFPGISRTGASLSYATMRGVDKQHALNWTLILSIPALLILCVFDIVGIVTTGGNPADFVSVLGYILSSIGAFTGAYLCLFFIRTLISRSNITVFAYYSWGVALLIFVLYLIS